jgi:Mor family transcriptional regulator
MHQEDLITFLNLFGGRRVFLPSVQSYLRSERERAVLRGWRDGLTYKELAARYGICERTARRITTKGRRNTP